MKKRVFTIIAALFTGIMLGYLFVLCLLLGFLASKYVAGKSEGEPGKVGSIVIPFRSQVIHLHHWLYSLWLIGIGLVTGIHFLTPAITYGLLGGSTVQGIYCYNDWHIILIKRNRTIARKQSVNAAKRNSPLKTEQADATRLSLSNNDE